MSQVASTDELVTKTDLATFYQGILPYLGGMPEMVANKFTKSDLYSTDEKIIGQWINGKPVYQKVCVGTFGPFGGSWANVIAKSEVSSDMDKIVSAFCMIDSDGTFSNIRAKVSGDYIQCFNTGWSGAIVNVLAFKYTKSTDGAISIGNETDYSTDEKIIGTWLDGKPLYQKCYSCTSPSSTSGYHTIITLDSNIEPKKVDGWLVQNNVPINCYGSSSYYMITQYRAATNVIEQQVKGYTSQPEIVVLQYTKTTD